MPEMMKALRKTFPGAGAELKEIAIPRVDKGLVLVKVEIAAICGSDQAVYRWSKNIAVNTELPFTMGHEYCGTVVEVGDGVQNFMVGDRVVGETHVPCGKCYMCRGGNQHLCVNMRNIGKTYQGCFAEYILVPESCLIKIDQTVDPRVGAIMEPLGVAVHALQKTSPCGGTLAVLGCGPIGLMTINASKQMGAHTVFSTSRSPAKLKMAEKMGADYQINSGQDDVIDAIKALTNGGGVDVVIEASGSNEAFLEGLEILKNQGRFCLLGIPTAPIQFDADRYLIRKELNITGIWGRKMYSTWLLVEQFIASGKLDLDPLLGSTYELEDYASAFEKAASGTVQRIFLNPV